MKVIILAAGYGTRLGMNVPKHLVKVAGKEMVFYLLDKLKHEDIFVITNDWGYELTKKTLENTNVKILNDGTKTNETRLGTIGDILFTIENGKIDDDVLIIAGDNLFEFDLGKFIESFKEKGDSIVLFDVKDKEIAKRMGIAAIDDNNKIIDFIEKPLDPPSTLAGTLCYLFKKETISLLKKYKEEGNNLDKAGSFIEYLHKIKSVYGWVTDKTWFDIGDKEQLRKADEYFQDNSK